MIIGLTGLAGSGKSEAARYLRDRHGFIVTSFARPLKDMLKIGGFAHDQLYGDRKSEIDPRFGVTPRAAMQKLGMFFREQIDHDFWIKAWKSGIEDPFWSNYVVDDIRFDNEVAAVRSMGGIMIKIERPGVPHLIHVSERGEFEVDATVVNDGSVDDLTARLEDALAALPTAP